MRQVKLEQGTVTFKEEPKNKDEINALIQASIACSLKRIADVLEQFLKEN